MGLGFGAAITASMLLPHSKSLIVISLKNDVISKPLSVLDEGREP